MSTQGTTAKYIELSNEVYEVFLDTFTSAMQGRIDYWKSVVEIASRPYPTKPSGSTLRETFTRASELTNLTFGELSSRVQRTADFSEKILTQFEKLQATTIEMYRESLTSYVSAVDKAKDASAELADGLKQSHVSTVEEVKDVSTELVDDLKQPCVSTVREVADEVKDASAESSVGGAKHRKAFAGHVSST
jgi:uncharacterized phage infection (PIP) family protein YhgE